MGSAASSSFPSIQTLYCASGNSRCSSSFGTLPLRRGSSYGNIFSSSTRHIPIHLPPCSSSDATHHHGEAEHLLRQEAHIRRLMRLVVVVEDARRHQEPAPPPELSVGRRKGFRPIGLAESAVDLQQAQGPNHRLQRLHRTFSAIYIIKPPSHRTIHGILHLTTKHVPSCLASGRSSPLSVATSDSRRRGHPRVTPAPHSQRPPPQCKSDSPAQRWRPSSDTPETLLSKDRPRQESDNLRRHMPNQNTVTLP
jgi:hypothetical protein